MAKPTLLQANGGKLVPTLPGVGSIVRWPLVIGTISTGFDDDSGWTAVATHQHNVAPGATDGYVALAGYDGTVIRRALVDTTGRLLVDNQRRHATIAVTPAVSNGTAYAAKDAIGALLTFAGAGRAGILSGMIEAVTITDKGQQMAALDLILFSAAPGAPTDNLIFAPSDAEVATIIGVVHLASTDYYDFSTNSVGHVRLQLPYLLAGTSMYGVLVSRGTPTYTSVSDVIVTLTVRTD